MADVKEPQATVNPDAFSGRMYDHDKGTWVDVPAEQLRDTVLAGTHTFAADALVPMYTPEGEVKNVPASNVYDAVKDGQWQFRTPQTQAAWEAKQHEAIDQKNVGDMPLTAAIAGAARMGTLGLSDAALSAAGLGDITKKVAQHNEGATFAGEAVGAVAPLPGGMLASGAGKAARGVVEGAEAAGAIGNVVSKIAAPVAQMGTEGAIYGLGSGITEQALGHPDDALDNLLSHAGAGAVLGGTLGGIFGTAEAARPLFDTLVEKAVNGGRTVVDKIATEAMVRGTRAALTKSGMAEAEAIAGADLMRNPEFQAVYDKFGADGLKKAMAAENATVGQAKETLQNLRSDFKNELRDASEGARKEVTAAMHDAGGDIFKAVDQAHARYEAASETFATLTRNLPEKLTYDTAPLADRFEKAITDLTESSSAQAKNVGRKLEAEMRTADLSTQTGEASFFFGLRNMAKNVNREALPPAQRRILDGLVDEADQSLLTHPNPAISKGYEAVKQAEQAVDHLRAVGDRTIFRVTKTTLPGEEVANLGYKGAARIVDEQKMARTLANPRTRQTVAAVFDNLEAIAPELKAYGQGLKTVEEKIAVQNQLEAKLAKILPNARIDGADALEALKLIGDGKGLTEKLDKVLELQKAMTPSANPMDRVLQVKQALGQPISQDLQTLARMEAKFALFNKIRDVPAVGMDAGKAVAAAALTGSPGHMIKAALSGALFGLKKSSVEEYFNVLSQVRKTSERGAETLQRAIKGTASFLTGSKAQTVAKGVGYASLEGPTLKEKRRVYEAAKQQLTAAPSQEPHPLNKYAPSLTTAVQARQAQITQFLASKFPEDPFRNSSISAMNTGFVPSDHDLSKFYRYVQAASNPLHTVEAIKANKASPEEVETLKTVYPGVYQKLQNAVMDGIIKHKADLSYQQKILVGTLFSIPTDYTLLPDFIGRMQDSFAQDPGGRPEGPSSTRTIKLNLKPETSVATSVQQTTYGLNK